MFFCFLSRVVLGHLGSKVHFMTRATWLASVKANSEAQEVQIDCLLCPSLVDKNRGDTPTVYK